MAKLFYFAIFAALVAVLACSSETPTPAPANTPIPTQVPTATSPPTATPEPSATPAPTATPQPSATSTPEPTATAMPQPTIESPPTDPAPQQVSESDAIAPLNMDDPAAIASELSDSELACLAGVADTEQLLRIFAAPEMASPEEQAELLNCLEDDTVTRIFITGVAGQAGPLSRETSTCIRAGMEGIDLRSVMLAGVAGDEGSAMVGGMAAYFLSIACLNDDEWEAVASSTDISQQDRESLQCVMEDLGGPEAVGQVVQSAEGGIPFPLITAALTCGVSLDTVPGG